MLAAASTAWASPVSAATRSSSSAVRGHGEQRVDAVMQKYVDAVGRGLGLAELLSVVFGGPLPESVTIYPPFFTEYGLNTTFGENVFVNQGCTFMDKGGIRIGNGVMIAPKVSLITGGHPLPLAERREYLSFAPIVIEDDVWIGTAACGGHS